MNSFRRFGLKKSMKEVGVKELDNRYYAVVSGVRLSVVSDQRNFIISRKNISKYKLFIELIMLVMYN